MQDRARELLARSLQETATFPALPGSSATQGRTQLFFVVGDDADPLWLYFSYALAEVLAHQHNLECRWVRLVDDPGAGSELHDHRVHACKPSARDLAHLLRRQRARLVHALGATAIRVAQRARWLLYPAPFMLYFPGEDAAHITVVQRLLHHTVPTKAERYVAPNYDRRAALLAAGIAADRATVIPWATRRRTCPSRSVARDALGVDPLRLVMVASFEAPELSDPQWMALEVLAESIHRRIPSLLLAATTAPAIDDWILQRAQALDVVHALRCVPLLPHTHDCVAGADVALLTSSQAAAPWLALAAVDAGVPVVKSPVVRLPTALTELPAARELLHPLARDDLDTWLDALEDFRPRRPRASSARPDALPLLPTLEDVAQEYVSLYRRFYRNPWHRR